MNVDAFDLLATSVLLLNGQGRIEAAGQVADVRQVSSLRRCMESVEVTVTTVGLIGQPWPVLIETRELEQRVLADRSKRLVDEIDAHRELLRNLAHEVKTPWAVCAAPRSYWKPSCPTPC